MKRQAFKTIKKLQIMWITYFGLHLKKMRLEKIASGLTPRLDIDNDNQVYIMCNATYDDC